MIPLVATYRVQLRSGVTFASVEFLLPYLEDLGISHIYLSPVFTAASGSTHGYDVTDPNSIEPSLGGEEGFSSLVRAAHDRGLGIILDIVPNHTAFSLENLWLRDLLRHGDDSVYAGYFDRDPAAPLLLPFLDETFESKLMNSKVAVVTEPDGPALRVGEIVVPLDPRTWHGGELDEQGLRNLHQRQNWRLTHWELERDAITHRRFFNITSLIGMRVEDPDVFEAMHRLVLNLVKTEQIDGLRVDHVDGLADPAGYLHRLRSHVGDLPIWVEKILTGDEALPDWPVEGTTGYEAGRAIAAALTDAEGLERLDSYWRKATGRHGTFHDALLTAKAEVIDLELSAELITLTRMGAAVINEASEVEAGEASLREAIRALLLHFPRYRTYFSADTPRAEDLALLDAATEDAARDLRSDTVLRHLSRTIATGDSPAATDLRIRFQQMTGAMLAKSHEDTAGFRFNRFLAANEVGADPDEAVWSPPQFESFLSHRLQTQPRGLTLTSSHDTKRSEDARMRLVAISHLPEDFLRLWHSACGLPGADAMPKDTLWYICQSFVAIWEGGRSNIPDRLADHILKAVREAKEITNWTHPDTDLEAQITEAARRVATVWMASPPPGLAELAERAEALSFAQLALKFLMPGVPDIYQGTEGGAFGLTDPDNRLPVDYDAIAAGFDGRGFNARKLRLMRALLDLRRRNPAFFLQASCSVAPLDGGGLTITRRLAQDAVTVPIPLRQPYEAVMEAVGNAAFSSGS